MEKGLQPFLLIKQTEMPGTTVPGFLFLFTSSFISGDSSKFLILLEVYFYIKLRNILTKCNIPQ